MTLDLHYQSANLVKYRTDVTFGWLDLMVAFGGIAGLFLGSSILSSVEIFYYIIIISMILCRKAKNNFDKFLENHAKEIKVRDIQHAAQVNKKNSKKKSENNVQTIKVISLTDIDRNERNGDNVKRTRY